MPPLVRTAASPPAYLQVSRDGLTLHLTGHYGDCFPGSTVFVRMTGVAEFHREITGKGYKYLRPGLRSSWNRAKGLPLGSAKR
jgi:hypothetical protein